MKNPGAAVFIVALAQVLLLIGCAVLLFGCAQQAHTVATDVTTVDKPVPVGCRIEWPTKPTPHVALVQLSGNKHLDALLVWRAAEAELEERIAYEKKLEAAARECAAP